MFEAIFLTYKKLTLSRQGVASLAFVIFFSFTSAFAQDYALEFDVRRDTLQREVGVYKNLKVDEDGDLIFYFDVSKTDLDPSFSSNARAIFALDTLLSADNATRGLDSIVVEAAASIDGPLDKNAEIANLRARSVADFMLNRYPGIKKERVQTLFIAEDWVSFRQAVEADLKVPHRDEVLEIIDLDELDLDARAWKLKTLHKGESWDYLAKNIFPKQRTGASLVFYYEKERKLFDRFEPMEYIDSMYYPELRTLKGFDFEERKPWFALKTNLLYDAVTAINVELEVPIGNRWSVAGEWIFPWWVWDDDTLDSRRDRFQILTGTLEGRYWLGDRESKPLLTGWFAGAHLTYGSFDFENNKEGYQSKNLMGAGLSLGYAHTINKSGNLRLEYGLSLGYAQFDYKEYTAEYGNLGPEWDAYRDYTKSYAWVGPTRARVSLVWMLTRKGGSK